MQLHPGNTRTVQFAPMKPAGQMQRSPSAVTTQEALFWQATSHFVYSWQLSPEKRGRQTHSRESVEWWRRQVPPCWHASRASHAFMCAHVGPSYPSAHAQVTPPLTTVVHVPPWRHASSSEHVIGSAQVSPRNPGLQSQTKWPSSPVGFVSRQRPPLRHGLRWQATKSRHRRPR